MNANFRPGELRSWNAPIWLPCRSNRQDSIPLTRSQRLPPALAGLKPCVYSGTTELRSSLHGHGVDLIAADFQFDAVGRPQIVSLHDGAAHQDVSGELLELKGIKDGAAAGINDHGMRGLESVLGRKLRDVIDVRKLTVTEGRFQRKCPIGFAFGRRTRQANNERRNILR